MVLQECRTLAVALQALGHSASHTVVATLLHQLSYSLQGNVKTREGRQHPDRDAQFHDIAETVKRALRRRQPAFSVDTHGFMASGTTPSTRLHNVVVNHLFPDKP